MAKATAPSISASDQEEIRAVVMRGQEIWNRHDMKAWAERLTDEAMHWRGKAAVLKAHEVIHCKIFHSTEMTITDVAIRAAISDVAVAVVTLKMGEFTTPEGELRAETQDKLSLILVKCEDGWRITHGHNTVVDPKAQPFDPVNSGWSS